MRITNKTLQVNFEHDVTVGNAIEATLVHIAFISENEKTGDIDVDLDFADIDNVKFMGIPIGDGYENYRKFKKTMSELGIDITETFNFKAKELITDENMETLRQLYRDTVK